MIRGLGTKIRTIYMLLGLVGFACVCYFVTPEPTLNVSTNRTLQEADKQENIQPTTTLSADLTTVLSVKPVIGEKSVKEKKHTYKFCGVVIDGDNKHALLSFENDVQSFVVGDTLPDGTIITQITSASIIISENGLPFSLKLFQDTIKN